MNQSIMISICCISYNQEKYIKTAIESFLNQNVGYSFEILIHDDASTDNTPKIIKEYEARYPNIIKAICNTENQYSKGIAINPVFNYPRARGKYIALCEGDDYFLDPEKLRKQIDYLEKHPECHLCFHNAFNVDVNGKVIGDFLPRNDLYKKFYKNEDSSYSSEEMIALDFIPTNSMVFRRDDILKLPQFYFDNISICGDLSIRLYLASLGSSFGFAEKMSAYRKGSENSASQKASQDYESMIKTLNGHIKILNDFNDYSNKAFDLAVKDCINYKIFAFLYRIGATFSLKSPEFYPLYRNLDLKTRMKYSLRTRFGSLYRSVFSVKR